MEGCPNEETIEAFVAGRLDRPARQQLETHVDECKRCSRLIARLLSCLPDQSIALSLLRPAPGETWTSPESRFRLPEGLKVGRFMILGGAGAGGMGTVYAAYDTALDRKIALKFLASASADEAARMRLFAEASAMAKLSHPNVVTVYDVGVFEGQPYLAMELVEGQTLAAWRRAQPRSEREIVAAMAAAGRGLAAAHAVGIIHRDVKPQNILVAGGRVVVTDFGLSVNERSAPAGGSAAAGTPGYMAPEQFEQGVADARTDVFGFCATLYEMLAGVVPFAGSTLAEVRDRMLAGQLSPPAAGVKVPARLQRLALRGMSLDPRARPPTITAVVDELLADRGARVRRTSLALGVAAVVGGAFWGGGILRADPERRCLASAAVVDRAWNDGRRDRLRARYASAGKSGAWPVLERRLDEYTRHWRDKHAETCTATYGDRRQSEQVLDLRMQCLEGRRSALEAFVGALASASAPELVQAAGAQLPAVAECDLSGRGGTRPLPADPQARAAIARIEDELGKTDAELVLGKYPAAAERAGRAVEAARKAGYEPLLARALGLAAQIEANRGGMEMADQHRRQRGDGGRKGRDADVPDGPPDRAVALFEETLAVAERGGDDGRRAFAARELVAVHTERDRLREARLWAELASALVARLGDPPVARAALEHNVGWLNLKSDRRKEAAAAFGRALALRTQALGPRDPQTVLSLVSSCSAKEHPKEMLACQRQALPLAEAAFGPQPLAKESLADMKRDGGALDLQIGEIRQFMAELKCDRYE